MQEHKVECWDKFRELIDETLPGMRLEHEQANAGRPLAEPLFRGVGNSDWGLETTLERSIDAAHTATLGSYYQKIDRSKPAVEALTAGIGLRFQIGALFVPNSIGAPKLDRSHPVEQSCDLSILNLPSTSWVSISPPGLDSIGVCGCTFAFDSMDRCAKYVAVYVYIRDSLQSFGSDEHLFVVGPYIRTHPRHFLQQSQYSLCLQLRDEGSGDNRHCDYRFLSHGSALE